MHVLVCVAISGQGAHAAVSMHNHRTFAAGVLIAIPVGIYLFSKGQEGGSTSGATGSASNPSSNSTSSVCSTTSGVYGTSTCSTGSASTTSCSSGVGFGGSTSTTGDVSGGLSTAAATSTTGLGAGGSADVVGIASTDRGIARDAGRYALAAEARRDVASITSRRVSTSGDGVGSGGISGRDVDGGRISGGDAGTEDGVTSGTGNDVIPGGAGTRDGVTAPTDPYLGLHDSAATNLDSVASSVIPGSDTEIIVNMLGKVWCADCGMPMPGIHIPRRYVSVL